MKLLYIKAPEELNSNESHVLTYTTQFHRNNKYKEDKIKIELIYCIVVGYCR
jgi:hypothetical protein